VNVRCRRHLVLCYLKEVNLIVFRFEDGEDVIENMERIAKEHQITSRMVISGDGNAA